MLVKGDNIGELLYLQREFEELLPEFEPLGISSPSYYNLNKDSEGNYQDEHVEFLWQFFHFSRTDLV